MTRVGGPLVMCAALLLATLACDQGSLAEPQLTTVAAPLSPADLETLANAERALAAERPAEVAALLEPLVSRRPAPPRALFLLGWSHYQMQHYGDCVALTEAAIAAEPELAASARVLGFAHYKLGSFEAARDAFARFLEAHPQDYRALYGLGLSELALGQHDAARPLLEGALEQQPSYSKAHYALARLLEESGRPAEALPHVRFVLQREPFHVEGLYLMSQVQKALGDGPAAGQTLERWRQAYSARERIGPLQQQVREGRADAQTFALLAREHAALGDEPQARAALLEGLRSFPGDGLLTAALAGLGDD